MLLFILFLNLTYADMQRAASKGVPSFAADEMVAPQKSIALSELKAHFTKASHQEILKLIALCEVLEVKTISSHGSSPQEVQSHDFAQAIREALKNLSNWEKKLTPQEIVVVDASQDTIKRHFTDQGIEWAWVLKQMGQAGESKSVLVKLFETKASELMGSRFLTRSEKQLSTLTMIDRVLTPQSSPEENKARTQKLQKVKTHISNLPDVTIMT